MHDTDDIPSNPTSNPHLIDLIDARLSRRTVIGGAVAAGVGVFLGGVAGVGIVARRTGRSREGAGVARLRRGSGERRRLDHGAARLRLGRPHPMGHSPDVDRRGVRRGCLEHVAGPGAPGRVQPRRHALLPAHERPQGQPPWAARAQPRVHRRQPDLQRRGRLGDHARRRRPREGRQGGRRARRHDRRDRPRRRRPLAARRRLAVQPARSRARLR